MEQLSIHATGTTLLTIQEELFLVRKQYSLCHVSNFLSTSATFLGAAATFFTREEFFIIGPISLIRGATSLITEATCYSDQLPIGSGGVCCGNLFLYYRSKFLHSINFLYCWSNCPYYWSNLFELDTVNFQSRMLEFLFPRTRRQWIESGTHF